MSKVAYEVRRFFKYPEIGFDSLDSKDNSTPIVYHFFNTVVSAVDAVKGNSASKLPDELVMRPGIYSFAGHSYSLEQEGLYRFMLPERVNAQRIVYDGDPEALLSALSWIVTHGDADNQKSMLNWYDKSLHSKLYLTCGSISLWANQLLSKLKIKSRIVASITLNDWNTFDDGHKLIEVWDDKRNKWVLYDLDNNAYFIAKKSGLPLSLLEFSEVVADKEYKIIKLSFDILLDVSNFKSKNGYDYGFYSELMIANISDWYSRVMQVPIIYDELSENFYFMDEINKEKIEKYSSRYHFMNKTEFMKRFYANEK